MKKRSVFVFENRSRAAVYGVGTYTRQLTECFSGQTGTSLHIVSLNSEEKEFSVIKSTDTDVTTYLFPAKPYLKSSKKEEQYYRNVWYMVKKYVQEDNSGDLYFVLNYFYDCSFVPHIKNEFPTSVVLFVIHYFDWCFSLKGNTTRFRNIIHKPKEELVTKEEEHIFISYEKEKRMFQNIDFIISLSTYTRDLLLLDYEVPREKIRLIYNGLKDEAIILSSKDKVALKRELTIPVRDKIILFVGRLDDIKGIDVLISAFKEVVKKRPMCRLIIAGEGDFSKYMKECNGYWGRIIFTGRLKKNDLYRLYQVADVGVMPSMHEQCSYVAIEMMMFGLPLIASVSTGLREMVKEGENGWQIPITENVEDVLIDSDVLSEKILNQLSLNPEEKKRIQKNSRINFLENYSLDMMREKYIHLLCENKN